jgi:hypothetical protein
MTTAMRIEKVATREVAEPGDGGVAPGWAGDDGDGESPLIGGVGEGGVGVVPDEGGVGEGGVGEGGEGPWAGAGEDADTLTLSFWPLVQWPWKVHVK